LLYNTKYFQLALPEVIQEAPGLPKTRSGKITRRILRKIAEGDAGADLGDISTLIDEAVIPKLWENRKAATTAAAATANGQQLVKG
jgi:acetyl-CoA synthetase